jgi:hypothetical protein
VDLINFDIKKTLNELESRHSMSIASRGAKLRSIPVKDLTIEEIRIMIQQNRSLKFLVPLAIERLHINSLVKGDGYEGDLLNAVLTVEKKFWITDLRGYIPMLNALVETALALANSKPEKYQNFLQHCNGAIKIFKSNVGIA